MNLLRGASASNAGRSCLVASETWQHRARSAPAPSSRSQAALPTLGYSLRLALSVSHPSDSLDPLARRHSASAAVAGSHRLLSDGHCLAEQSSCAYKQAHILGLRVSVSPQLATTNRFLPDGQIAILWPCLPSGLALDSRCSAQALVSQASGLIGVPSCHFLAVLVAGSSARFVSWAVAAQPDRHGTREQPPPDSSKFALP